MDLLTLLMAVKLAPKPLKADVIEGVADWLDDHPEATTTVEDGSITEAKLASALKTKINNTSGLTDDIKEALLECFAHVAWTDAQGQDYLDDLEDALYPSEPSPEPEPTPATLSSITAVYTQSGTVYDTDSLDSLKTDLVVTAVYSDSTTQTLASTDYTLSGTLTAGTSTITVSYGGKTTTFTVTVTGDVDYNDVSLWEQGGLNANGTTTTSTSRLRTINYISSAVKKVSVDSGYSYILVCYDSNGHVKSGTQGYYNPNNNTMTNTGVYYTGEIILDDIASVIGEYNNIKVLMRNESNPSATITTTEGLKIHLKG